MRGSSLLVGVLMLHALMAGPQQAMAAASEITSVDTLDRDVSAHDPYPVTQVKHLPAQRLHGGSRPRRAPRTADQVRQTGLQVATPWRAETVQDLWNEYRNIFQYGNR